MSRWKIVLAAFAIVAAIGFTLRWAAAIMRPQPNMQEVILLSLVVVVVVFILLNEYASRTR